MQIVSIVLLSLVLLSLAYDWWLSRRHWAVVTRLPMKPGDLLLMTGCSLEAAEQLAVVVSKRAKGATVIWLDKGQSLERLSDEAMEAHGWVRKEKAASANGR